MTEPLPAEHDLPPVLISEEAIVRRVDELAGQISSAFICYIGIGDAPYPRVNGIAIMVDLNTFIKNTRLV